MKRIWIVLAACLLCMSFACTKEAPAPETPAVTVPETVELKLTLPLGTRDGVAKALPAFTAGFASVDGKALTFSAASADPAVAECVLRDDGTLYVIAHATGETTLTVTAKTAAGEQNAATVSVTVRDARRMLVLILAGVLSVALLIFVGKPSAQKPAEAPADPVPQEDRETESNTNPERS